MIEITLQAIANQSLSVTLNGKLYTLTIKETNGVMSITVVRDDETIVMNNRLVPGAPVLPYAYLEDGNFILLTSNGDYPYYTEFGSTQSLLYVTQEELNSIRGT